MASFDLNEEQRIMKDEVHNLANALMREGDKHREYEKAGEVTGELLSTYQEMQLALVDIPEELGGVGMGAVGSSIISEELGWGDAGAALGLPGPGMLTPIVMALGSEAQQKNLLTPFVEDASKRGAVAFIEPNSVSDPAEFGTTWEKKGSGFILNGSKAFVLNGGSAETIVVFAVEKGGEAAWNKVRAFAVKKANPGLKTGQRRLTLGLCAAEFTDITLESCEVAAEYALEKDFSDRGSLAYNLISAAYNGRNIGMARAASELANEYTMERVAFGKPIAQHQGMSWYLVDMMMGVEAMRLSSWQAAYFTDTDQADLSMGMRAVMTTDESALAIIDKGVQALGGSGFIQDFPMEKWSRDARTHTLLGNLCPYSKTALGATLLNSQRPV